MIQLIACSAKQGAVRRGFSCTDEAKHRPEEGIEAHDLVELQPYSFSPKQKQSKLSVACPMKLKIIVLA